MYTRKRVCCTRNYQFSVFFFFFFFFFLFSINCFLFFFFFFFFFFFCAIPQKSVIFVVSLTKSISVWVYPTAFFFVVYPFDCLLLYGNGLQCEALGSGVCWVPKSLIVRTSHHRFMCTESRTWGSIFCVPFSSLSSRIRRIIFCSVDRWELLCLWQAGKVILSHINLIGLTDSFEYR